MLVRHRHGRHSAPVQQAVLEDWGEPRGAVATTYSHDSHNLVVIGQGYWLAQKRLSKGRFVWWPEGTGPTKPLEAYEAQLLMAAGDLSRVRAAPMWRRVSVLK